MRQNTAYCALLRRWQSGQMHVAVNHATSVYAGSNPARRTISDLDRLLLCSGYLPFLVIEQPRNYFSCVFFRYSVQSLFDILAKFGCLSCFPTNSLVTRVAPDPRLCFESKIFKYSPPGRML